jgi:hypothetical protein
VIPVVSGLLMSGVPLAPVMAFWVASPTMDPEMFALTVATLGWPLAVTRLAATLGLSLGAGYLTLALTRAGWLTADILRRGTPPSPAEGRLPTITTPRRPLPLLAGPSTRSGPIAGGSDAPAGACCTPAPKDEGSCGEAETASVDTDAGRCGTPSPTPLVHRMAAGGPTSPVASGCCGGGVAAVAAPTASGIAPVTARIRSIVWPEFGRDVAVQSSRLGRWLALAFLLEALMLRYVPQAAIASVLGTGNALAVIFAALVGIPLYLNNVSALPIVSGLLAQGMQPGAAVAFLIAGPVTTVPAMSAVWGVVRPRVFGLYLGVSLVGAIVLGYLTNALLG